MTEKLLTGTLSLNTTNNYKLTYIPNDKLVKRIFTWSKSHGKCWEKRFPKFIHEIELSHLLEQDTVCVANTG